MKPYMKLVVIVGVIVIVSLLVYFIWTGATSGPATNNQANAPYFPLAGLTGTSSTSAISSNNATSALATASALTRVSDKPVDFFWTEPSTGEVFYLDQSGVVWQAEAGQKNPQITQQGVAAVNFIKQSPDGQSVLAAFGDPHAPGWGIYDVVDQVWRPLPSNILNATWGVDSNTLITTEQNGSNINLVTLDLTKTPPKPKILVSDFRFLDTAFNFIPPNTLLIEEKSDVNYGARIWGFNTKTSAINLLMGQTNGLVVSLANNGSTLITYSSSGGFQILQSQTLQNLAPLPFTTLPSKCSTNSGSIVYCFIPTNADWKNASLPNDYTERKIYSNDALYGIDTANGASTLMPINTNGALIDAEKPALAGSNLYFINRFDNYLYALNIGSGPTPIIAPSVGSSSPGVGD